MDTIRNYIDNMFAAIAPSEQIRRLKEDMLAAMEDKYNELKASGKSENEAIGIVISEFGNIDEIMGEMDISIQEDDMLPTVDLDEATRYLSFRRREGFLIGLGVFLCITSPLGMMLTGDFGFGETWTIIQLFVQIAIAVSIFIYCGFSNDRYKYLQGFFHIPPAAKTYVERERELFRPQKIAFTIAGVALLILSPVSLFLLGDGEVDGVFRLGLNSLTMVLFFLMIGVGVWSLIYGNYQDSAFDMLLQQGGFSEVEKKKNKEIEAFAGVYWTAMVVIYLAWSFRTFDWHFTWIIWPIAGVSWSFIASVYSWVVRGRR